MAERVSSRLYTSSRSLRNLWVFLRSLPIRETFNQKCLKLSIASVEYAHIRWWYWPLVPTYNWTPLGPALSSALPKYRHCCHQCRKFYVNSELILLAPHTNSNNRQPATQIRFAFRSPTGIFCSHFRPVTSICNNRIVNLARGVAHGGGRTEGRAGTSHPAAERRDGLYLKF